MRIHILIVFLIGLSVFNGQSQEQFAQSSVLKSGKWYKIKVNSTGIYKLTYSDLKQLGFETPENVRIYGNSGRQLSYVIDTARLESDDLKEIPLYASSPVGNFSENDYYLFYAEGTDYWYFNQKTKQYIYELNDYSYNNYYYITTSFGSGLRINEVDYSNLVADTVITTYDWLGAYEEELYNFINTGRDWFGQRFDSEPFTKSFQIDNIIKDNTGLNLSVRSAVRSGKNKTANYYLNDLLIESTQYNSSKIEDTESSYSSIKERYFQLPAEQEKQSVKLKLIDAVAGEEAYVDYITITSQAKLIKNSTPFFFRSQKSVSDNRVSKFRIENSDYNARIWNVSEHNNVQSIKYSLTGSIIEFISPTASLHEFVAVDINYAYPKPILNDDITKDLGWIENQNLHSLPVPDMLIVTHPSFLEQAERLANLHREKDQLSVVVATTLQVYNEFASGKADACAIRNFARMFYERSEGKFRYLLLFGDGSYDNRNFNASNPNYIPTYQSLASNSPTFSYTSDDLYAMLEHGEFTENGTLDIGVGRLPVMWDKNNKDLYAKLLVNKIEMYYDSLVMKDYRNHMIFLGDDGESGWDNEVFMTDSDKLTQIIEKAAPEINFSKIYLDSYTQISSSTGASYPDAEDALIEALTKGALVFNYMGHGGPNGITQERVLQRSDVEKLTNAPYFPLFVTATCQMSRFDDVEIKGINYTPTISLGEAALLNPDGGAIALFTTTRLVYQSGNMSLSSSIFNHMFERDSEGNRYRLGDLFRISKNNVNEGINELKFTLLGDPAITLPYGEFKVITDSINNIPVSDSIPPISALDVVSVSGYIASDNNAIMSDFNGVVFLNVFDKAYLVNTQSNDGIPTFQFKVQDRMLYRGKASVVNGRFKTEFLIPKDISYSLGTGKISYYAQNGTIDAKGYFDKVYIGGPSSASTTDFQGPEIQLFMNDTNFKDGGLTNSSPVFIAHIFDESGINTTGNGIGHDLIGILDSNSKNTLKLNNFYEGNLDDYKSGVVRYPLKGLSSGQHQISLKVWDNCNNSSEDVLNFYVTDGNKIIIEGLYNYPNPMSSHTWFQYTHNMPGEHDVTIDIFDLSGRLVKTISQTHYEAGFVSTPILYNSSTNSRVLDPGVYPYRLKLKVNTGLKSQNYEGIQSGRLIIIPR